MAVSKGRDVLIKVDLNDAGTGGGTDYVKIAQQRGGTLTGGTQTADSTHKDDNGWESAVVTSQNWSISADGALDPADPVLDFLRTKWKKGELIWVQFDKSAIGGPVDYGQAWVTQFDEGAPQSDLVTYTIELKGDGELFPLPAP